MPPSERFRDALRWLLSESGQRLTIEASGSTYIRSLEGGEWCVGSDPYEFPGDEVTYLDVDEAIQDYVRRVSVLNDW